jgi:hypothetical protein
MLARHLPRVAAEHERARVLASDRARDLLRSLDARDAGLLVQGSLFDREALRAAEVRTRDSTARRASLQRHLDRLASSTLVPGEVDVLLCALTRCDWPHDGEEKT